MSQGVPVFWPSLLAARLQHCSGWLTEGGGRGAGMVRKKAEKGGAHANPNPSLLEGGLLTRSKHQAGSSMGQGVSRGDDGAGGEQLVGAKAVGPAYIPNPMSHEGSLAAASTHVAGDSGHGRGPTCSQYKFVGGEGGDVAIVHGKTVVASEDGRREYAVQPHTAAGLNHGVVRHTGLKREEVRVVLSWW